MLLSQNGMPVARFTVRLIGKPDGSPGGHGGASV